MNRQNRKQHNKVKFIDLWLFLSREIGNSRLPLNVNAQTIHELVQYQDEHNGFITKIIQQTYKQNRCHHLTSPINIESVLDNLGETAYHLRDNQQDDLLHIELLEEIGWHIIQRYGHMIQCNISNNPTVKGEIISLMEYRTKRANNEF